MFISVFLVNCNKEKKWSVSINSVDEITYSTATIKVEFDVQKSIESTNAGLYYGTVPNPNVNNAALFKSAVLGSEVADYELTKLNANTTYYIIGFIQGENGIVYSEEKSFRTANTPELDCDLVVGKVYYSAPAYTMTYENLEEATEPLYAGIMTYSAESDFGELNFSFLNRPASGVYSTRDDYSDLKLDDEIPFTVRVECDYHFDGAGCYYGAVQFQAVHVNTNEAGVISISFCELDVVKKDGDCLYTQKISGKLSE
jgi:hypothetical protein